MGAKESSNFGESTELNAHLLFLRACFQRRALVEYEKNREIIALNYHHLNQEKKGLKDAKIISKKAIRSIQLMADSRMQLEKNPRSNVGAMKLAVVSKNISELTKSTLLVNVLGDSIKRSLDSVVKSAEILSALRNKLLSKRKMFELNRKKLKELKNKPSTISNLLIYLNDLQHLKRKSKNHERNDCISLSTNDSFAHQNSSLSTKSEGAEEDSSKDCLFIDPIIIKKKIQHVKNCLTLSNLSHQLRSKVLLKQELLKMTADIKKGLEIKDKTMEKRYQHLQKLKNSEKNSGESCLIELNKKINSIEKKIQKYNLEKESIVLSITEVRESSSGSRIEKKFETSNEWVPGSLAIVCRSRSAPNRV